jgi:hypothetical protein
MIAIILLIDIIQVAIIVLIEFCSQIRPDFGIADGIWVN